MRSKKLALFLALAATLALGAGACNNTTPPRLYASMAWKMRCPSASDLTMNCNAGCTEGMDRAVANFSGVEGTVLSCSVTETPDQRILNVRMARGAQSVVLQNIVVPRNGGSALSGVVRLSEDNDYTGAAGGLAPSDGQPCQISNVTFSLEEGTNEPTIRGRVLCSMLRADADRRLCRGLSASGGVATLTVPADFEIFSCSGLSIAP